ncbi:MAG TPA: cupredoxin domain-containing protein [Candidatus Paceibacterota bacterium]|nr:cupredoxin domain-containing protein [Candidatus Paceibacterota bacterium]
MNKKQLIILIVLGLVVGLVFLGGVRQKVDEKESSGGLGTVEGGTRKEISDDVETPEAGESVENEEIAVPVTTYKASEKASASKRVFNIKAEGYKFSPSVIVVDEKDVVNIEIKAVDQDYNVFFPDFGVYKELPSGERIELEFQVSDYGEYEFFCNECEEEMGGKLIVNEGE